MIKLTENQYQTRRADIERDIQTETESHQQSAYLLEVGVGNPDHVVQHRSNIEALKDRLIGLDAAWDRQKAVNSEEVRQTNVKKRAADATLIIGRTEDLKTNARDLTDVITRFCSLMDERKKISEAIRTTAAPWTRQNGQDGMFNLIGSTLSLEADEQLIGGTLYLAGHESFGTLHTAADARTDNLIKMTDRKVANVMAYASRSMPELVALAAPAVEGVDA